VRLNISRSITVFYKKLKLISPYITVLTAADQQASICPSISVPAGDSDRPICLITSDVSIFPFEYKKYEYIKPIFNVI
jgi:hypothetical protein